VPASELPRILRNVSAELGSQFCTPPFSMEHWTLEAPLLNGKPRLAPTQEARLRLRWIRVSSRLPVIGRQAGRGGASRTGVPAGRGQVETLAVTMTKGLWTGHVSPFTSATRSEAGQDGIRPWGLGLTGGPDGERRLMGALAEIGIERGDLHVSNQSLADDDPASPATCSKSAESRRMDTQPEPSLCKKLR